jgi:hypothetical protein
MRTEKELKNHMSSREEWRDEFRSFRGALFRSEVVRHLWNGDILIYWWLKWNIHLFYSEFFLFLCYFNFWFFIYLRKTRHRLTRLILEIWVRISFLIPKFLGFSESDNFVDPFPH